MKWTTCKGNRNNHCGKRTLAIITDPMSASPASLSLVSGGEYSKTDTKNFEPNGQFASHDSILPPTDALVLPAFARYLNNRINGMNVQATTENVNSSEPTVEVTPNAE